MEYEFDERRYLNNTSDVQELFKGKDNALLILGCGFDPRMNEGVKLVSSIISHLEILVIHYGRNNNKRSKTNEKLSQENLKNLKSICGSNKITEEKIERYSSITDKTDTTYYSIQQTIKKGKLDNYQDIILDISAMPRAVSFSLIRYIWSRKNENQKVYVIVCENSKYDDKIDEIPARDSANYMQCFNLFTAGREAVNDSTSVWLPVMGDHEIAAFRKIAEFVKPDEICPVIPFPAVDVRRGEKIIRSYGNYLFKELKIEKRNIIYVPENHPFLIYKKLCNTINFYEHVLHYNNEEEIKYVFSSQSSKLMDMGILLALLDLNKKEIVVTMAYVDNDGYSHTKVYDEKYNQLSCICLDDKEFDW